MSKFDEINDALDIEVSNTPNDNSLSLVYPHLGVLRLSRYSSIEYNFSAIMYFYLPLLLMQMKIFGKYFM